MDLWIRTQDRTGILKADTIFVFEKQIVKKVYGDDLVKGICLGTYATKERALEVLDEIQDLIIAKNNMIYSKDVYESTIRTLGDAKKIEQAIKALGVYEMPKE